MGEWIGFFLEPEQLSIENAEQIGRRIFLSATIIFLSETISMESSQCHVE